MEALPYADVAIVFEAKIVGYLLKLDHEDGGSKARFFLRCGFTPENWCAMADALRDHARENPVVGLDVNPFGRKFEVDGPLRTPSGQRPMVRSVWMIDFGESTPRLVTAFPRGR
jgi:hypothetical protein